MNRDDEGQGAGADKHTANGAIPMQDAGIDAAQIDDGKPGAACRFDVG